MPCETAKSVWSREVPTEAGWYGWRDHPDMNPKCFFVTSAGEACQPFYDPVPVASLGGEWYRISFPE